MGLPRRPRGRGLGKAILVAGRRGTDEAKRDYIQARTGSTGAWSDLVLGLIG
jgi:hypothetical protein